MPCILLWAPWGNSHFLSHLHAALGLQKSWSLVIPLSLSCQNFVYSGLQDLPIWNIHETNKFSLKSPKCFLIFSRNPFRWRLGLWCTLLCFLTDHFVKCEDLIEIFLNTSFLKIFSSLGPRLLLLSTGQEYSPLPELTGSWLWTAVGLLHPRE